MQAIVPPSSESSCPAARASAWLALWSGAVFGVALVKLGSPVILAEKVHPPQNLLEMLMLSWPVRWGYALLGLWLLGAVALAWRLPLARPGATLRGWWRWTPWLLLGWLVWQALAAWHTVEPRLTRLVLPHFLACGACFLAGRFVLARTRHAELFWGVMAAAVAVTLVGGMDQRFGGLEETRRQFEQLPPEMRAAMDTPEFRARLASQRVFSTFFYPNAFAGGLLLALPAAVALVWRWGTRRHGELAAVAGTAPSPCPSPKGRGNIGRQCGIAVPPSSCPSPKGRGERHWGLAAVAAGATALAGVACLIWTGSKAGWLLALAVGVVVLMLGSWPRRYKVLCGLALVAIGLAFFAWKYSGYLSRGAPSVGARLTYWRVAWDNACRHPWLGTGPGTFAAVYRVNKPPEAEMTHLTHNDYLQQATDSGWPGLVWHAGFILGMLVGTRPVRWTAGWPAAAWLGVLGWALQGMVEFGLYLPALAWPAFLWLGWLRAERTAEVQLHD